MLVHPFQTSEYEPLERDQLEGADAQSYRMAYFEVMDAERARIAKLADEANEAVDRYANPKDRDWHVPALGRRDALLAIHFEVKQLDV